MASCFHGPLIPLISDTIFIDLSHDSSQNPMIPPCSLRSLVIFEAFPVGDSGGGGVDPPREGVGILNLEDVAGTGSHTDVFAFPRVVASVCRCSRETSNPHTRARGYKHGEEGSLNTPHLEIASRVFVDMTTGRTAGDDDVYDFLFSP